MEPRRPRALPDCWPARRKATALPEFEPGTVLFNRLWPLALLAVAAGALGFFFPPVPAVAVGYALLVALLWRKQSAAVEAIEGRDGVEFWMDRSSAFGPPQLVRVPGLRKIEPEEPAVPLGPSGTATTGNEWGSVTAQRRM